MPPPPKAAGVTATPAAAEKGEQDGAAEEVQTPPQGVWNRFEELKTGRACWVLGGTEESFYEDEDGWVKYLDGTTNRYWWHEEATGRCFYE